mmetsp:Transcript_13437/g.34239  ORF Transcript_13437/g.34239 Transcript_13437/m.34239 type:complete len:163 (+) Transcript_13437:996-1484(+)
MTSEGKSVSDGNLAASAGFLSSSMIYLPYFIAGFLFKKHSTLQNFVQLAQTNKLVMWVPRILALVWLITMLALAISHDAHPADVFGIHAEGCNAIPTKFETLAPWPSFQRWPDFGCILLFQVHHAFSCARADALHPRVRPSGCPMPNLTPLNDARFDSARRW